jgi:hypothetical protein
LPRGVDVWDVVDDEIAVDETDCVAVVDESLKVRAATNES